ncbi:MAG: hypothetical protein Q8Q88_09965 [Phenylobacterium sp.]|uniref:hypothetical protein n=1 Tax=Phenylobacterium sp. TaxID=1871053 RepID=UPI0027371206|nr:hypothetical protein [Phenylobacterium sp.]MDP3747359.1 hypothetical protein [Phenylobacterium sp.]
MLSRKGRGRHSNVGTIHFWCLVAVFASSTGLAITRWAQHYHLFILGALAMASAWFGRIAMRWRWRWPGWVRLHLTGMGGSYILLLTVFCLDNGRNLPPWRELAPIAFWLLPSAVGLPIIAWALLRHPLARRTPGLREGPTMPSFDPRP